ncbi:Uncharacterized protein FWK35_00023437 [Aphis craccivora]|uniref:MULE domain-containing protein n=1 Tax=Aphis craccivora TaxID=307492 RepID=A0A6G0W151_APHCR|nr:Uncharacterized protein FWK35_00023437 [Aphis craccivora]
MHGPCVIHSDILYGYVHLDPVTRSPCLRNSRCFFLDFWSQLFSKRSISILFTTHLLIVKISVNRITYQFIECRVFPTENYYIVRFNTVIYINLFDKNSTIIHIYSLYTVVFRSCCRAYKIQIWSKLKEINLQKMFILRTKKKVKLGIRWVCVHKDLCNGTLTTDEEITTVFKFGAHNHEMIQILLTQRKLNVPIVPTMKNTAKENYNLPSRIYARIKRYIGNENSIKRSLRRIRSNIYPKISKIDDIFLEGTHWSMTGKENSESFLFYDNKNNENLIIIFSSETCIDTILLSLWTVVYTLLQRKNKETYIELLTALKDKFESLSIISIDFEYVVYLTIGAIVFLPFKSIYLSKNVGISLLSNYFKSLEGLDDILVYFDSTYVNGTYKSTITEYGTTRFLRHPVSTNIFTTHVERLQCHKRRLWSDRNNVSEWFNNKLKNIIRIKHPNLYMFIESIQMCNASATTALVQKQNEIINISKILSFKEKKLYLSKYDGDQTSCLITLRDETSYIKNCRGGNVRGLVFLTGTKRLQFGYNIHLENNVQI